MTEEIVLNRLADAHIMFCKAVEGLCKIVQGRSGENASPMSFTDFINAIVIGGAKSGRVVVVGWLVILHIAILG